MKSRRFRFLSCLGISAALAVLYFYLGRENPPGPGVRWSNVERIEIGMTQADVKAILGEHNWAPFRGEDPITDATPPGRWRAMFYSDEECDIWVYLDESSRVVARDGNGPPPPSRFRRAQKRLGWKP